MRKQITYIAPLRAGIILAVLYGILSLIIVPIFLLAALLGTTRAGSSAPAFLGVGFAMVMPLIYAVMGFVFGVVGAALYNLITKWTGGFEVEVRDVALAA